VCYGKHAVQKNSGKHAVQKNSGKHAVQKNSSSIKKASIKPTFFYINLFLKITIADIIL